jgi:hypothetical protein
MIRGIGSVYAREPVRALSVGVFELIDGTVQRLGG